MGQFAELGSGFMCTRARLSPVLLSCLLAATVLLLYLPLIQFPFVQDDWALLHQFTFQPAQSIIHLIISPGGSLFYRPLGILYCWLVYLLFGLHPLGFHLLSLLALMACAFIVVAVAYEFTGDRLVSWTSGFLFATSANVLIDPQMWLSGVFDIGATVGGLLCLYAFLRNRFALSALYYMAAVGFKESMAMMFFVVLTWTLLKGRGSSHEKQTVRQSFDELKWHGVVFVGFLAHQAFGASVFALQDTHPYAARLLGTHIGTNFLYYSLWALQATLPLKNLLFSSLEGLTVLCIAAFLPALLFAAGIWHRHKAGQHPSAAAHDALFTAIWFLLLLYPALTLKGHLIRYYLLVALPPLAIGVSLLMKFTSQIVGGTQGGTVLACFLLITGNLTDAAVHVGRRVSLGVRDGAHISNTDGGNRLIGKAAIVRNAWNSLVSVIPAVPTQSLLVIGGLETGCFADKYGIQVWYRDSTLTFTSSPISVDSAGFVRATIETDDPWNRPDATSVRVFPLSRTFQVYYGVDGIVLKLPANLADSNRNATATRPTLPF
ncbi:MAG TPA: hypothetical protein VEO56_00025 [Bacteroidota bacterium]|nr:hypothetical protein [Bacteroidota bacterium]